MNPLLESAVQEVVTETAPAQERGGSHAVPAADAAAWSLVFLLVFCVVCFVLGAAVLGRRKKEVNGANPEQDEGGDEAARRAAQGEQTQNRAEWEREGDWWKKQD